MAKKLKATPKYVLTGGACTGKTTLLNEMTKLGYQGVPEIPTLVFEECHKKGIQTRGDSTDFQRMLLARQLELESKLTTQPAAFLDRSAVDIIAFCRFFGITAPKEIIEAAKTYHFAAVFMLDFLPFFETDSNAVRWGTVEDAKATHILLKEVYREFGYNFIDVPPVGVAERVNIIQEELKQIRTTTQRINVQAQL